MKRLSLSPVAQLLVVMVAAIATFLADNVYSQLRAGAIDQQAATIGGNASPSIDHLSTVRSELHRLQVATVQAVSDAGDQQAYDHAVFDRSWRRLAAEMNGYLSVPLFPGEQPVYAEAARRIAELRSAVDATLARLDAGDLTGARTLRDRDLFPAAERADAAVAELLAFNNGEVRQTSAAIARARRRTARVSFALHGATAALALLAVLLAVRVVRHQTASLRTRSQVAEVRAEELDLFAGRVAHDLRNPLQAILLRAAVVPRDADARTREAFERIARSAERMRLMLDGLLEFARAGATPQPGATAEIAPALGALLPDLRAEAERDGVTVTAACDPALVVACGPGPLASVLANLLRNALRFVVDGHGERRVAVRARAAGEAVRVEVQDTGPGVPPGEERRIFEPFARGSGVTRPGIGLGLATVRRVVEAHRGRVGVESESGRGACFWFELPRA